MKLILAFAIIVLAGIVLCAPDKNSRRHKTDKKWLAFKNKHLDRSRHFKNDDDEANHFENFMKTDAMIEEHNAKFAKGEVTYEMGHNPMSADSEAERKMYQGRVLPEPIASKTKRSESSYVNTCGTNLAKSFDWVAKGWNSPIRNQKFCGGCWAFATAAALEAHYWIKNQQNLVVSPQQMIACATKENFGCLGGWPAKALDYIYSVGGITTESNYPYESPGEIPTNGTCREPAAALKQVKVSAAYERITAGDLNALKCAISTRGPVTVGVDASAPGWGSYKTGVFTYTGQTPSAHAVLAVGYGTDAATGQDFIKIKNSWGDFYGESGYIRINPKTSTGQLLTTSLTNNMVLLKLAGTTDPLVQPTQSPIIGTCINKAGDSWCSSQASNCETGAQFKTASGTIEAIGSLCASTCNRCGAVAPTQAPLWPTQAPLWPTQAPLWPTQSTTCTNLGDTKFFEGWCKQYSSFSCKLTPNLQMGTDTFDNLCKKACGYCA